MRSTHLMLLVFVTCLIAALNVATGAVGRIERETSVKNGIFSYSIPLQVPPGLLSVRPTLSIEYSSHGKVGLFGSNWDLGGISVITRCLSSVNVHGFKGGVYLNENDVFCLDGQRLLNVGGNSYKTAKETWFKITAVSPTNQKKDITEFQVVTREGWKRRYTGVNGQGPHLTWSLSEESDTHGNTVVYNYNQAGYLQTISYGGNPTQKIAHTRSIQFSYRARKVPVTTYSAGVAHIDDQLITSTTMFVGGEVAFQYLVDYVPGTSSEDRIQSIRKCGADMSCFTTKLQWSYVGLRVPATGSWNTKYQAIELKDSWKYEDISDMFQTDVNGDGLIDLTFLRIGPEKNVMSKIYVSPYTQAPAYTDLTQLTGTRFKYNDRSQFFSVDVDGDGLLELILLWQDTPSSSLFIFCFRGTDGAFKSVQQTTISSKSFSTKVTALPSDVNGDGKTDLFIIHKSEVIVLLASDNDQFVETSSFYLPFDFSSSPESANLGDINGDGLSDLLFINYKDSAGSANLQFYILLADPKNPGILQKGINYNTGLGRYSVQKHEVLDINGDGNTDIVVISKETSFTVRTFYSTGNGQRFIYSSSSDIVFNPNGKEVESMSTSDLNADGYDDLTVLVKGDASSNSMNTYVYFGGPQGISKSYNQTSLPNAMPGSHLFVDYLGNGRSQLVVLNENNWLYLYDSAFYPPLLVSSIDEGYNSVLSLEYQYITNDIAGVYKGTIPSAVPLKRQRSAFIVVSAFTMRDTSSGVQKKLTYSYQDIATDISSGAFVGFAKVLVRDVDGTLQVTEYNQEYPLSGTETVVSRYCDKLTTSDSKCAQSSEPILLARIENKIETLFDKQSGIWEVRQVSSTELRYEYGQFYSSTTTDFKYSTPSYGCIVEKIVTDRNRDQTPIVVVFKFEFLNDVSRNSFGYVTSSKTFDSSGTVLRQAMQSYDLNTFDVISVKEWNNETNSWPTTTRTYDAVGSLTTATEPIGGTTTYTYDYSRSLFFLSKIAPPNVDGVILFWNYTYHDKFNDAKSETDRNGITISTEVDSLGRTIASWGPDDSKTVQVSLDSTITQAQNIPLSRYSYITDETNSIVSKQEVRKDWADTQWITTTTYYDAFSRAIKTVSDGANEGSTVIQKYEYDVSDNLIKSWIPYFSNTPQNGYSQTQYDVYGRVLKTIEADQVVSEIQYDPSGLRRTQIEASGTNVQQETIVDFKFIQGEPTVTDLTYSTGVKLSFDYSILGEQLSTTVTMTNGNRQVVKSTQYSSFGQPAVENALNTATKRYIFDSTSGLISAIQLNGATSTTFKYDLSKRIINMNIVEPKQRIRQREVTFSYDDSFAYGISESKLYGKLCKVSEVVTDENGSKSKIKQTFAYDSYGRHIQHKVTIDDLTYRYVDTYTPSQTATTTYPDGASILQTSYTRNGMLEEFRMNEKSLIKMSNFNPSNEPQRYTYGNGYTSTVNYDVVSGLKNEILISSNTGQTKFYNKVQHNPLRQVVNIADRSGKILEEFQYSKIGELVSAVGPYGTEKFEYDQLGNLVEKDGITFEYSGFRVTKGRDIQGNVVFSASYDEFGNMIKKKDSQGKWEYKYNEQLRLSSVSKDGQVVVSYEYDFSGHRIKRVTPDSTIVYPSEDYEVNLSTNERSRYVLDGPMNSARVEVTDKTTVYYYANHIENNVLITTDDGKEMHLSYKPFGEDADTSQSAKFKFSGRHWDQDARLYYFRERFYDPAIGRFISADSVLGGGDDVVTSYNRYAYVLNSPLNYIDPNGQSIWDSIAGIIVGVVEVAAGVALDILSGGTLAVVGNGLIGAGTSGILYSATNFNHFSWKQYAIEEAIGGVTDLAFGAAGMAISKSMSVGRRAATEAAEIEMSASRRAAVEEERSVTEMFNGCSFCLTGDTKVLLHDLSTKPVRKIEVGDVVVGLNGSSPTASPVTAKFERYSMSQLHIHYSQENADTDIIGTMSVTPNHRIFVDKNGYIVASDIRVGDRFVSLTNDNTLIVVNITSEELARPILVYNLEVANVHNYFISDHYVLVHNGRACPRKPITSTKQLRKPSRQRQFAKIYGKGLVAHDADHTISLNVFRHSINKSGGATMKQLQRVKDLANSDANFAMVPSHINRGPNNVADNKIVRVLSGSKKASTVADKFLANRIRQVQRVAKVLAKKQGAPSKALKILEDTLKTFKTAKGVPVVKSVKMSSVPDTSIPEMEIVG